MNCGVLPDGMLIVNNRFEKQIKGGKYVDSKMESR
jgi:hypothetical protein